MATPPEPVEIYCLKCRTNRLTDVAQATMKNGRPPCVLYAVCAAQANNASAPPGEPGPRLRQFCPFRA